MPPIKELLKRTEEHIKGMVVPGTLFEELGFNYIGPVDGHDVLGLVSTLKNMRDLKGPQFLHIMTKKGRGYEPAEKDPITFHAVPKFDHTSGVLPKSSGGLPSYSKIFGDWLCETAAKDNKLMAITPAMREGSGMVEFSKKFPIGTLTSPLPSSMRSPSPPGWRLATTSRWWRSTPPSCSEPTIR